MALVISAWKEEKMNHHTHAHDCVSLCLSSLSSLSWLSRFRPPGARWGLLIHTTTHHNTAVTHSQGRQKKLPRHISKDRSLGRIIHPVNHLSLSPAVSWASTVLSSLCVLLSFTELSQLNLEFTWNKRLIDSLLFLPCLTVKSLSNISGRFACLTVPLSRAVLIHLLMCDPSSIHGGLLHIAGLIVCCLPKLCHPGKQSAQLSDVTFHLSFFPQATTVALCFLGE